MSKSYARHNGNRTRLVGAVIGLARAVEGNINKPDMGTHQSLLNAVRLAQTPDVSGFAFTQSLCNLHAVKARLIPRCATCSKQCGRNNDFNLCDLAKFTPEIQALKRGLMLSLLALANRLRHYDNTNLFHTGMEIIYNGFYDIGHADCRQAEIADRLESIAIIQHSLDAVIK